VLLPVLARLIGVEPQLVRLVRRQRRQPFGLLSEQRSPAARRSRGACRFGAGCTIARGN
jgi:hypothetical protein